MQRRIIHSKGIILLVTPSKKQMMVESDNEVNALGFLSQSQMEKIFVRGILSISRNLRRAERQDQECQDENDETVILQEDLTKITKQILEDLKGPRSSPLKDSEKQEAKDKACRFHHWYQKHNGPHPSERGLRITQEHTEKITPVGGGEAYYDCNHLTDEWFKWFLTTPSSKNPFSRPGLGKTAEPEQYGSENAFLMQKRGTSAYFTTASPFQVPPDVKSITLTTNVPLLVPAYNVYASTEMFPSLDNELEAVKLQNLQVEVISDLLGINPKTLKAKFDGQNVEPCCVIRIKPLRIENIPDDNVIGLPRDRLDQSGRTLNILHGGFWMLIVPERLSSGDHLLEWNVDSINYSLAVKIRINALV